MANNTKTYDQDAVRALGLDMIFSVGICGFCFLGKAVIDCCSAIILDCGRGRVTPVRQRPRLRPQPHPQPPRPNANVAVPYSPPP